MYVASDLEVGHSAITANVSRDLKGTLEIENIAFEN